MAIVITADRHDFAESFKRCNRQYQFTCEGLDVLFDYLEEISNESDEPIELDVIALCCEYYESTIEKLIASYNIDVSDAEGDEDEIKEIVEEYLNDHTSICGQVDGGFVYATF